MFDLFGSGEFVGALPDEECLIAAPDQCSKTTLGHESRCADVSEIVIAAFDESDEAIALQDEVRNEFRRNDLNARSGELLQAIAHIL